jgi:amidohydrolase
MKSTALSLLLIAALFQSADVCAELTPELQQKIVQWRRDIHQNPELGNREFRTSKLVAEHLRSLGLEVKTGVAATGVVAILKTGKPGPRIALRADMDALPVKEQSDLPFASKVTTEFRGEKVGVMHACGHDAHTAILMGVAEALVKQKDKLRGEVMFVFQPAEEGPPDGEKGGAPEMLAQGLFANYKPDAMFGLHVFSTLNAGDVGVRPGPTMAASDRFRIVVKGKQTHGSRPWGGVDPIYVASRIVDGAQSIVSRRMDLTNQPVVVSFGAIKGGVRFNIIPDEVELIGTIRTFDPKMREQVFAELISLAEHTAKAHNAEVLAQVPDIVGNPVTFNHVALTERMRTSLEKAVGAERVKTIPLNMGAEDFAYFAQEVPSMYFFVGATPQGQNPLTAPSNHSPQFFLDEKALEVGSRALLQVSLDYLNSAP